MGISILSSFAWRNFRSFSRGLNFVEERRREHFEHKSLYPEKCTLQKMMGKTIYFCISFFSLLIFVIVAFSASSTYVVMRKELGRQNMFCYNCTNERYGILIAIGMYKLLS